MQICFIMAGVHLFPVLIKHNDAIKLYVRVEIQLQTFFTLALAVGEKLVLFPRCFILGTPNALWTIG